MSATYHIQVDWDADGSFAGPGETLDRDVIAAEWALGLDDPAEALAAPARAAITLRDRDGRYRPENPASPLAGALVPRRKVRITSVHGGVERVHFTGWIESITPARDRTATLRCAGVEALLQRAEVFLPLLVNVTADTVIAAALAQVAYPPALLGYWLLGQARVGQDTRLPDVTTYADLEAGRTAFACVGDWQGGISAWAAIRAAAEAERGLCFVSRTGRVVFWNRHHLLYATGPAQTLTERDAEFTPALAGASMINRAVITCHPRMVSAAPETLWTLAAPLRLPPGAPQTIRARFLDEAGQPLGALAVEPPQAGTDYTAGDRRDGSGEGRTGYVTVSVAAAGNSALLTFTNHYHAPVYLLPGARLRGSAVRDRGAADAVVEHTASILRFGRRAVGLDLPLLSTPEEAARVARFLVTEGSMPHGRVEAVTLRGEGRPALRESILARTVGDCLRLADGQTGHTGLYHIVGERHTLARGGAAHTVTWIVRPAARLAAWRLGVTDAGELGAVTHLVY